MSAGGPVLARAPESLAGVEDTLTDGSVAPGTDVVVVVDVDGGADVTVVVDPATVVVDPALEVVVLVLPLEDWIENGEENTLGAVKSF
jgi:hypothetical protein